MVRRWDGYMPDELVSTSRRDGNGDVLLIVISAACDW